MVFQSKQQTVYLELIYYLTLHQLNTAPLLVGIFKLPNANVKILLAFMLYSFYRQYTGKLKKKNKQNKSMGIRSICITVHIASTTKQVWLSLSTSTQESVKNSK